MSKDKQKDKKPKTEETTRTIKPIDGDRPTVPPRE
jgi:hypothetical protein